MSDEKDEKPKRRHPWPPPEQAECYPVPYFLISVEPTPEEEQHEYGRGEKTYTLVSAACGKGDFVLCADEYVDVLEAIIQRACIPVHAATPRLMAEALYGEPRWTYNLARRGQSAEYQHPFLSPPPYFEGKSGVLEPDFSHRPDLEPQVPAEPEKTEPQTEPPAATPTTAAGDRICPKHNVAKLRNGCRECRREQAANRGKSSGVRNPICPRHGKKTKDGMKHGHQQYRCVACLSEKPAEGENPLRFVEHAYEDFCTHHNRKKYKNGIEKRGKQKGKQKYRCPECLRANKGKLPADTWRTWSGEELRDHFLGVARKHGASPQNVEDAAHSMIAVLSDGTRTFEELHEPAVARRYISSINRLSADGHTTLDLDAPVGTDDKSKMTFADTKPAAEAESNPHQQLEAKEAVNARLNGGASTPDQEESPSATGANGEQ